jgi:hypothetical protein
MVGVQPGYVFLDMRAIGIELFPLVRMLPPLNTTDEELEAGFALLEKALARVGDARGLPC